MTSKTFQTVLIVYFFVGFQNKICSVPFAVFDEMNGSYGSRDDYSSYLLSVTSLLCCLASVLPCFGLTSTVSVSRVKMQVKVSGFCINAGSPKSKGRVSTAKHISISFFST